MSRAVHGAVLGIVLALAAPLQAQEPDAVARLRELAKTQPDKALAELARLSTGGKSYPLRIDAARARAEVLHDQGRARDAEAAWRALLGGGVDVTAELLELVGARLTLTAPDDLSAGKPATLQLDGANTGPLTLRLYAVDAARWRQAHARAPKRGVFAHLRAPPPASLRKLHEWRVNAAQGKRKTRTPRALEQGLYLLTATARGVSVPLPLVVSDARGVVRRGVGAGLLFLARRSDGEPLGGVQLMAYDENGLPLRPLGRTDGQGLLRYSGSPAWAAGWTPSGLCVTRLLRPAPPVAPPGLNVEADLPHHSPGQIIRLRAQGGPVAKSTSWTLRLIDPGHVTVSSTTISPSRSGVARASLPLPANAALGAWTVDIQGTQHTLRVVAPAPGIGVTLDAPSAISKRALPVRASVLLPASGLPVAGELRWRLLAAPAQHTWSADPIRPLPRYAPRARGPLRELCVGRVRLDEGQAAWDVPLPAFAEVHLLRLEAWIADGPAGAHGVADVVAGPHDLVVAAVPERLLCPPRGVVRVRLFAAHLDGRPAPRTDLLFDHRPRSGASAPQRRLRTDSDGTASTTLSLAVHGAVDLRVSAGDSAGKATLWVADPQTRLAPAGPLLLVDPATDQALAVLPFEKGTVLVTREGAAIDEAKVRPVRGSTLAWSPSPPAAPGTHLVVSSVHDGKLHTAATHWPVLPERLKVKATARSPLALPGQEVQLDVETLDRSGKGRSAVLTLTLHPEGTARALDRQRRRPPLAPHAVRGSGEGAVPQMAAPPRPLPQPLSTLAYTRGARSNGEGRGRLRVTLPQRPGLYWARVEATDSSGRRGGVWCPLRVKEPLRLDVTAPAHLVEGDESRIALRVRTLEPLALFPDAALRVSWRGVGVKVSAPRIEGSHALLEGDPGADTVRIAAAPDVRLVFDVGTSAPGSARVELSVSLEKAPSPPLVLSVALNVRPRGLSEVQVWTGHVESKRSSWIRLQLPADAVKNLSELRLAVDPEPATACLAGLADLARHPATLRASLQRLVVHRALAELLETRKLQAELGPSPSLPAVLGLVSAARDPSGAWGAATPSIVLWLLRARRAGFSVPDRLIDPAIAALPKTPRASAIRALAGVAPPARVAAAGPGSGPDGRVYLALAREVAGQDPAAALAAAVASRAFLKTTVARAELLGLLARSGDSPKVRSALVDHLLLARSGPGWRDPDVAAAALLALIDVAKRAPERKGSRLEAFLESTTLLDTFSGGGLAEWQGTALASAVRNRSRLRIRSKGGDPLRYAASVRSWVRRTYPKAESSGLTLTRSLKHADGSEATQAHPGDRLRLRVERKVLAGDSSSLLLVEIPLPGGCTLLGLPAGFKIEGGVLRGELLGDALELELLCAYPGEFALLPARIRSLSDERRATTEEARLKIKAR